MQRIMSTASAPPLQISSLGDDRSRDLSTPFDAASTRASRCRRDMASSIFHDHSYLWLFYYAGLGGYTVAGRHGDIAI